MYRNFHTTHADMRTLWFHQGNGGWFFTIHQNQELIFQSPIEEDRGKITMLGMNYLDGLLQMYYNLERKIRG